MDALMSWLMDLTKELNINGLRKEYKEILYVKYAQYVKGNINDLINSGSIATDNGQILYDALYYVLSEKSDINIILQQIYDKDKLFVRKFFEKKVVIPLLQHNPQFKEAYKKFLKQHILESKSEPLTCIDNTRANIDKLYDPYSFNPRSILIRNSLLKKLSKFEDDFVKNNFYEKEFISEKGGKWQLQFKANGTKYEVKLNDVPPENIWRLLAIAEKKLQEVNTQPGSNQYLQNNIDLLKQHVQKPSMPAKKANLFFSKREKQVPFAKEEPQDNVTANGDDKAPGHNKGNKPTA